jgi:hypothetical protein
MHKPHKKLIYVLDLALKTGAGVSHSDNNGNGNGFGLGSGAEINGFYKYNDLGDNSFSRLKERYISGSGWGFNIDQYWYAYPFDLIIRKDLDSLFEEKVLNV